MSSELPLLELASAPGAAPLLTITEGAVEPVAWKRSWHTRDGILTHRLGRRGERYVVDFDGVLTCEVNETLDHIVVATSRDAATVSRVLVHQLLPLLFAQRGALLIHASAVSWGDGAVALFGSSAAGKSTLAASLVHAGAGLVGDDALWLQSEAGHYQCSGTFDGVWLAPATCRALGFEEAIPQDESKTLVLRDRTVSEPVPLRALIWLYDGDDPDDVVIEAAPMTAPAVYFALYDHLFQLDPADKTVARRVFHHLTGVAQKVPGWRLKAPFEFDQLTTAHAIVAAIASAAGMRGLVP